MSTSTSVPASGGPWGWRTVDVVTVAIIGVAFGVVFWGWDAVYALAYTAFLGFLPALGFLGGVWTLAAVVGAAIVRRPGAAFLAELIAAAVELLLGNQFSLIGLVSGLLYGIGFEIVVAILRWQRWGVLTLAGAIAFGTLLQSFWGVNLYYPDWDLGWKVFNGVAGIVSAAVLGGVLGWLIVKAIALTGALNAFPPGRERFTTPQPPRAATDATA
ncbi:MAG: ECF transporter S component [Microbacterium sp.]